jgi:hypothetical protein
MQGHKEAGLTTVSCCGKSEFRPKVGAPVRFNVELLEARCSKCVPNGFLQLTVGPVWSIVVRAQACFRAFFLRKHQQC